MSKKLWCAMAVLATTVVAIVDDARPVSAQFIGVNTTADVTADDGSCSLREAIAAVNTGTSSGGTGECAAGTGDDLIVLQGNATYTVGTELPRITGNSEPRTVRILGSGSTIVAAHELRVLQVEPGVAFMADGITLTHRHSSSGITGRGFYNRGTSVLSDSTIVDNSEVGRGGGIYNEGRLTLSDSVVEGNSTVGAATVDRDGGGIHNAAGGILTVERSIVRDNVANDGGGIDNADEAGDRVFVRDSLVVGNEAVGQSGAGRGGGVRSLGGISLERTSVVDNSALTDGGGVHAVTSTQVSLANTTISGNSAAAGGGVHARGPLIMVHATVTANTAAVGSGVDFRAPTTALIGASIVAGNSGGGVDAEIAATATSYGYNVVGSTNPTPGIFTKVRDVIDVGDAGLAALGGDSELPTHALLTGSPALDRASAAELWALTTDQRGVARTIGLRPDSGAVEACGGSPWSVADADEFAEAITCFNGVGAPEQSGNQARIEINADIETATQLPAIAHPEDQLRLVGNGHTISARHPLRVLRVVVDGRAIIEQVTLTHDHSTTGISGRGLYNSGQTSLIGVTIADNREVGHGGGIYNDGRLSGRENTIVDNAANVAPASPADRDGGGMYNAVGGRVDLSRTHFDGNEGRFGGGVANFGTMTLDRSSVVRNSASARGGGIASGGSGSLELASSTVSTNTTASGGAGLEMVDAPHRVEVVASTITENLGPGISAPASGDVTVRMSIVAGNFGTDIVKSGGGGDPFTSEGYNIIGTSPGVGAFTAEGDVRDVADPRLTPLTTNRGSGDLVWHEPLGDSPALDHVTGAIEVPDIDQRNRARLQGAAPDAGAVDCPCRNVFTASTPVRYADSRDAPTFDGRFRDTGMRPSGSVWEIDMVFREERLGVVPFGASAVIVNLTVLGAPEAGFATAFPCGERPNASSINYRPGTVEPNEVIVKLSEAGSICVYTDTAAHVIVDVVGHVTDSPYQALTPARFADSRAQPTIDGAFRNTGIRPGGSVWEIDIAGRGEVPDDAIAAVVNLTVAGSPESGYATVFPCTPEVPNASSLNYTAGIARPNELVAELSEAGTICVFTLSDVHVIVDVVGAIGNVPGYTPVEPTRYADSRDQDTFDGSFRNTGRRPGGTTWEIDIAGRGAVPASASAVVVNVTVAGASTRGFVTVFTCTPTVPTASSLNYGPGIVRPNELIARLSRAGALCVYTETDVHVIVDVVGYTD